MFNALRYLAHIHRRALVAGLLVWIGLAGVASASQSPAVKKEHVVAQALADRQALSPGETAQLAVSLKMDPEWHVYWRNSGDGPGLPTSIEWSGPAGFKFGRAQFPVPTIHHDKTVGDSFVHEDTSYFVTDLTIPENAPVGQTVELKVKVDWLVCRESCIIGNAELTLKMPIAAKGTAAKPANEEQFKKARKALPLPSGKSPYVKITGAMEKSPVKPGDKANADLNIAIDAGHHLQSNKPKGEGMIATQVFVEPPEGFELEKIEYPAGKDRTIAGMTFNEYAGTIRIRIPFTVDADADKAPRFVRGILRYQACNEKGTCFPAENASFVIPVQMEGGAAPGKPDEPIEVKTQKADAGPVNVPTANASTPANTTSTPEPTTMLARIERWFRSFGNIGIVLMGFVGGILLNFMPCVLPVISLKVLSFVRQANENRRRILELGLAYAAGILSFFGVLAVLFVTFKQQWGEHFQNPTVVIILSSVVFAFALSLFGVFTIFTPQSVSHLATKAEGESLGSAYATGLLATLLGTACTGPFLSPALGVASTMPAAWGGAVFMAVGLGMATPFMLLSAKPAWVRFVPKPGKWMKTFEEIMGFVLLGTVIWLINPLRNQIGGWGMMMTLIFFIAVAGACVIKGRIGWGDTGFRKGRLYGSAIAVVAIAWLLVFSGMLAPTFPSIKTMVAQQMVDDSLQRDGETYRQIKGQLDALAAGGSGSTGGIDAILDNAKYDLNWDGAFPWQAHESKRVRRAVEKGYTVFVDYTADWCASCQLNKKSSIDVAETRRVMKELGVVPFKADYTNQDPRMLEEIKSFQRGGVPVYLVYRPHTPDKPEILPELLTPSLVVDALRRAGPSKVTDAGTNNVTLATKSDLTAPASSH